MKQQFYALVSLGTLGLPAVSAAQAPTLTSRTPARNTVSAPVTTPVGLAFSQPIAPASVAAVRVYSATAGGRKTGSYTAADKSVTFSPATAFKAGETVTVTVPATLTSAAGVAAAPQVYQFTTTVGGNGRAQNLIATRLPAGQASYSCAAGDLDNDGDVDILFTNQLYVAGNSINLLLNGGDNKGTNTGVFSSGKVPQVHIDNVWGSALGDVDGDGDLDIVLASAEGIAVFTNGGDASGRNAGTFYAYHDVISVGRLPRGIALGDVDGDGDLDIVSADSNGPSLTVCLNGGDNTGSNTGTFVKKSTFTPPVVGGIYGSPVTVALADVDGDGDLDALANNNTTVSVSLNGGNASGSNTGVFSSGQEVALAGGYTTTSSRLAVGDVDGDGDLDFAISGVSATGQACVSVRLNGGDATGSNTGMFGGTQQFVVPEVATGLAFGDMDADGDLDLAMATRSNKAFVRLNGGDASGSTSGVFSAGTSMAAGDDSYTVALADVDGDGDLDVITSDYGPNSGTVTVGLNQPPAPIITSLSPTTGVAGTVVTLVGANLTGASLKVGGKAAVITAGTATSLTFSVPAGSGPTGGVAVTTGGGTSTKPFKVAVRVVASGLRPAANGPSVGNLVELMLTEPATYGSVGTLTVHAAQAGGRRSGNTYVDNSRLLFFTSAIGTKAGFQPGEEVTVSVPAFIQNPGGLGVSPYVYRFVGEAAGLGRGNFRPGRELEVAGPPSCFASADVDADGDLDVLVVATDASGATALRVYLNSGAGTFAAGTEVALASTLGVRDLVVADADSDGDLDVLTANAQAASISVLLNNGRGSFTARPALPVGATPRQVAIADVNADGSQDLLVLHADAATVSVRLSQGYGFYGNSTAVAVGTNAQAVATGDVDGDGDLDLLTANGSSQTVSVRLNDGSGAFAGTTNVAVGTAPDALALADIDGDADLDLVLTNRSASTVTTWLNDGQGVYSSAASIAVGSAPSGCRLADVDADNDLDLLVALPATGTVAVWLNNGAGAFTPKGTVAVGAAPASLSMADLDGDGDLDLLAASGGAATVSIRFNQANLPTITNFTPTTGAAGTSVTVTGTSFTGATEVRIGSTPVTSFSVLSATSLTLVVPAGSTVASGLISITTPAGTGTSTAAFGTVLATAASQALAEWQAYPNPFRSDLTIYLPRAGAAQVALRDVAGRILMPLAPLPATGQLSLPASLPAGVYLLEVRQGEATATRRLLKL